MLNGNAQRYVDANPLFYKDSLGLEPNLNLFPNGSTASENDNYIYETAQRTIFKANDFLGLFGNEYTIASHGSPTTVAHLTPRELANKILRDPKFKKGMTIRLYACNTGKNGSRSYAQALSNLLKSPVYAPTSYIWYGIFGPSDIYGKTPNMQMDTVNPGTMKRFDPQ